MSKAGDAEIVLSRTFNAPRSLVTITLSERDNKTTLTLHTCFESVARKEAANAAGYSVSWGETLERLAQQIN